MFSRIGMQVNMNGGVSDGTSNTILVGETLPETHDHFGNGSWYRMNGGCVHVTTLPPINYGLTDPNKLRRGGAADNNNANQWNVSWGFRSRHSGGANFVYVDGSVHFVRETIDDRTRQYLGARNDGQVFENP